VISVHGDALANIMWMKYQMGVIEIFPYKVLFDTYRHLAESCGLYYFPVYTYVPPDMSHLGKLKEKEWLEMCDGSTEGQVHPDCYSLARTGEITVDLDIMQDILIDTFQTIGLALRPVA